MKDELNGFVWSNLNLLVFFSIYFWSKLVHLGPVISVKNTFQINHPFRDLIFSQLNYVFTRNMTEHSFLVIDENSLLDQKTHSLPLIFKDLPITYIIQYLRSDIYSHILLSLPFFDRRIKICSFCSQYINQSIILSCNGSDTKFVKESIWQITLQRK